MGDYSPLSPKEATKHWREANQGWLSLKGYLHSLGLQQVGRERERERGEGKVREVVKVSF